MLQTRVLTEWAALLGAIDYRAASPTVQIDYLCTDTRTVVHPEMSLFFALQSGRRDGHQFLTRAYALGIRQFVVSRPEWLTAWPDATVFWVEDVLLTLQALGAEVRTRFGGRVVGITGSNGKTIVKEWLFQCLSRSQRVVRSPRSYNSQIGVPLSLWQLRTTADVALIEAGISQVGEMQALARIIRPQIGVLTHLGPAHDEGFSSLAEKLKEKMRLFDTAHTLVAGIDHPLVREAVTAWQSERAGRRLVSWSAIDAQANVYLDSRLRQISHTALHLRLQSLTPGGHVQELMATLPFLDEASIENALLTVATLVALDRPAAEIPAAIAQLEPIEMRMEMKAAANGCTLINDAYSSDLESLRIAMDAAQNQRKNQSMSLILSDMHQTGLASDALYKKIADLVVSKGFDRVIGIGTEVPQLKAYLPEQITQAWFNDTDAFLQALEKTVTFRDELILLKGARAFAFERIAHRLQQKTHHAVLEVNLAAMTHNLNVYRRLLKPGVKMMAMVKAAGYGSGEAETAKLLEHHGVDYLGVAYTDEGIGLRKAGVGTPIMVLNPAPDEFDAMYRYQLEPEIYSHEIFQALVHYTGTEKTMPIHIKLDTGMHRLGFESADVPHLLQALKAYPRLRVASIFSHLAAADKPQFTDFTHSQARAFMEMYQQITAGLGYKPMRHIANSGAIPRFQEYQFEMVRLGIGLYGAEGTGLPEPLQVVHTLKARISQLRWVKAGETVGYNRNGPVQKDARIATVNIGYADGLLRAAGGGRYAFNIRGYAAPTVGNICMDMCMVDVTHIPDAAVGDEVIVFGEQPRVEDLAQVYDTISYEVFTGISSRVKRVYWME